MTKPIRPSEVASRKREKIPAEVIEVFNQQITEKFDGNQARIVQDDVVALLEQKGLNRQEVFDRNWLDVEDIFHKAGWEVEYDKPGFNESYKAFFIFRRPRKRPRK